MLWRKQKMKFWLASIDFEGLLKNYSSRDAVPLIGRTCLLILGKNDVTHLRIGQGHLETISGHPVTLASGQFARASCGHLWFFMATWASLWPLDLPNGRLTFLMAALTHVKLSVLRNAFLTFLFGKLGFFFFALFSFWFLASFLMVFVRTTYWPQLWPNGLPVWFFWCPFSLLTGRLAAKGATWSMYLLSLGLLSVIYLYFMVAKSSNGWKKSLRRLCFR